MEIEFFILFLTEPWRTWLKITNFSFVWQIKGSVIIFSRLFVFLSLFTSTWKCIAYHLMQRGRARSFTTSALMVESLSIIARVNPQKSWILFYKAIDHNLFLFTGVSNNPLGILRRHSRSCNFRGLRQVVYKLFKCFFFPTS